MSFDESAVITTGRLSMAPLRPEDADELAPVLADDRLHEFIGGRPLALTELRERYTSLAGGSPHTEEVWLNWIVRRRTDFQAIGTVQATLTTREERRTAYVAWVIGVRWQNQGFASEAARALVDWVRGHGADDVVAQVHPAHRASEVVAARAGLHPTDKLVEGEQVWRTKNPA